MAISSARYVRFVCSFICVFLLLNLFVSIFGEYNKDEFEHIHSAWYVLKGFSPYKDFYQHHHPLLWYFLAPFILMFGENIVSVAIMRFVIFLFFLGICFFVYLISMKVLKSKEFALISVLFLVSVEIFTKRSIEIRPDVPQVFFGLVSVFFLIKFNYEKKYVFVLLSGIFLSISFLFLQKSVFLLLAYFFIFVWGLISMELKPRVALCFGIGFLSPLSFYFIFLFFSGCFESYWITNWIVNLNYIKKVSFMGSMKDTLRFNFFFWPLALASCFYVLCQAGADRGLKWIAFLGAAQWGMLIFAGRPQSQYFMLSIALLAISASCGFATMADRFMNENKKILSVFILILSPLIVNFISISRTNQDQKELIEFVLENTEDSDLVYDGDARFNLYRKDLHYFWYSVEDHKGLGTYNRVTNGFYKNYDICELIKFKMPKIISSYQLDFKSCDLSDFYSKTRYEGLYLKSNIF